MRDYCNRRARERDKRPRRPRKIDCQLLSNIKFITNTFLLVNYRLPNSTAFSRLSAHSPLNFPWVNSLVLPSEIINWRSDRTFSSLSSRPNHYWDFPPCTHNSRSRTRGKLFLKWVFHIEEDDDERCDDSWVVCHTMGESERNCCFHLDAEKKSHQKEEASVDTVVRRKIYYTLTLARRTPQTKSSSVAISN